MKKIAFFFALLVFICGNFARGAERDVLAHATGDWCWFAKVTRVPPFMQLDPNAPMEQTEIFARQNGPGQTWHALPVQPGRAVSLAGRSSQLAVLMHGGQWFTVWPEGSPSGQPLPAKGTLLTLADDGTDLWAIGSVEGGIAAANAAIASDPATRPTTGPYQATVTTAPADTAARGVPISRLVVFHEQGGRWATVAELPREKDSASESELSMVVLNGLPMVAFKTDDGKVQIIRCRADHRWEEVAAPVAPPTTAPTTAPAGSAITNARPTVQNFCLFTDGYDPYFWQTGGNWAGEMFANLNGPAHDRKLTAIPLDWGKNDSLDGIPAATFSGGFVCVFAPHGSDTEPGGAKVVEQRYETNGKPFETAATLGVPSGSADRLLAPWMEVVLLCMMGFSVGASVFQQWNQSEKAPVEPTVVPAALFPRFAAGMIDLVPVIAAIAVILSITSAADNFEQMPSLKGIAIFAAGVLVYLLHTTLVEMRMGRSVGKWLMNLKVVTADGKTPTQSQMMIRNLLRVVDPLVMILVSPLRQRSADTVAGTVVIEEDVEPSADTLVDQPEGEEAE
jgi:uncharacterized RDD family membrane protein YckC